MAVVAGHHDYLADAAVVERTDGVLGLGPQGIVDTDHRRQLPGQTQIEVGVLGGQGIEPLLFPSAGMVQPSSSKTKWALPMRVFSPFTMLEMPWATMYCT